MNMQALMAQAQKMQRELKKAMAELAEKEFKISKSGIVTLTVLGNKLIKKVDIDEDALDKENKEMIEDAIVLAYQDALVAIENEVGDINERITGRREGLGM